MDPLKTVEAIFQAFARGDVPAILERLAADVEWEYGPTSQDVPWYQPQRGREGVKRFFEHLAAVEFHRFAPRSFLAKGGLVVVLLDSDYTVKATGRRVVYEDGVMIFRFNAAGEVVRFAHRVDFHQAWLAYRG